MLKADGLTQAAIGERIGWSREAVKNHISLIENIGTKVLDLTEQHQLGRVPKDGTNVPFDFTEGLFRNILPLTEDQQIELPLDIIYGIVCVND